MKEKLGTKTEVIGETDGKHAVFCDWQTRVSSEYHLFEKICYCGYFSNNSTFQKR